MELMLFGAYRARHRADTKHRHTFTGDAHAITYGHGTSEWPVRRITCPCGESRLVSFFLDPRGIT